MTRQDARRISSNSYPPSQVRLCAPLTWKMAPNIITDKNEAEILVKTPTIRRIPGTSSASPIKNAISGGIEIVTNQFENPGFESFP